MIVERISGWWPDHDWSQAGRSHGAFHEVLHLPDGPVARVCRGVAHRERAIREVSVVRAVAPLSLSVATPRLVSDVRGDDEMTAYLTSWVPGTARDGFPERTGLLARLREILEEVWAAPALALPEPRTWAGGADWLALGDELAALMPDPLTARARRVMREALAVVADDEKVVVHGDFGAHNLLWHDDEPVSLIDWDAACRGSRVLDVAPLVGWFGAERLSRVFGDDLVRRAQIYRASLPLQVAAAAHLVGNEGLRSAGFGNFATRDAAGTHYDPDPASGVLGRA